MSEVFELISREPEQVILKVKAEDNLTVAMHPYIAKNYDYITVTRGGDHILTIIYTDGHTFDFHWGISGYTLISDGLKRLKNEVVNFIEHELHIPLEAKDAPVTKASIFYNSNYKKWQLTMNRNGYVWSDTATCVEDMIEEAEKYYMPHCKWKEKIAQTGIPVWEAII